MTYYMDMKYLDNLIQDIFDIGKNFQCFIIGSFSHLLLKYYFDSELGQIPFKDIDLLTLGIKYQYAKQLKTYFLNKYNVDINFNRYSILYRNIEEVLQESALFIFDRFLFDISHRQLILDSHYFNTPLELITMYKEKDSIVNPDCNVYFYNNEEQNRKRLSKYNKSYDEFRFILEKNLLYTNDAQYIKDFRSNAHRYRNVPQTFVKKEVNVLKIPYYSIQKKFIKKVIKI